MKRLFTLLAAAVTLLTASAQSAGDYVYTDNGRFMIITGENILSNGDFSNGTNDWTTDGGNVLNADTFAVQTEGNLYYLTTTLKDNGPGTGSSLYRKVAVQQEVSYIISYQTKGNEDGVNTSVTTGETVKNYQNIFFNTDGSLTAADGGQIAKTQSFGFDWLTVTYSFTAPADGFIVIHFYAPYVGNCFANFKVMKAQKVVDDRESNALIARMQAYLNDSRFPNNHELLEEYISYINEAVNSNDLSLFNEYAALEDEFVEEFLDANTANVTSYLKNGNFDDLSVTSANQRKAGAWIIDDVTAFTTGAIFSIDDFVKLTIIGTAFWNAFARIRIPLQSPLMAPFNTF